MPLCMSRFLLCIKFMNLPHNNSSQLNIAYKYKKRQIFRHVLYFYHIHELVFA